MTSNHNKLWIWIGILLVIIIATGSIVIWSRYSRSKAIEISLPYEEKIEGTIYLDGAVNNPGAYPLKSGDDITDIIKAAGGATDSAALSELKLYIPAIEEGIQPQKIDINQAEAWLLQALPGIGETRAQAIIDYREENGRFQAVTELTKVEGIGVTTYGKIKHLITVSD